MRFLSSSSVLLISMAPSKKTIVGLLLCSLVAFVAHEYSRESPVPASVRLMTSYTTTSSRSSAVNQFCAGLSRTALVDASLTSQYNVFNSQMSSFFSLDGYPPFYLEIPSSSTSSTGTTQPSKARPPRAPKISDSLLGPSWWA
jgi:hypothetical protein